MPNSVLVVEDDTEMREYFAEVLRGNGGEGGEGGEEDDERTYLVTTAATLRQGIEALRRARPNVMLVDLGLPDGNGLDLIRRAHELSSDILTLVITVFGDESSVIGAIEAGAHGYLLKSEAPADVRESVRQILSGGAPISPGIASHLLRRFHDSEPLDGRDGPQFTPRERDVLELMVKGLPYLEAANMLGVTRNTVADHVKRIYAKLKVRSRGAAVYEALSQGIVKLESKN